MKTVDELFDRSYQSFQRSPRDGYKVVRAQLHHTANTSAVVSRDMMVSGSRQVSANAICDNDGELWNIVDRRWRAWTSADASYDKGSFTVETVNLSTNGWTISDASHEALAQLCAALAIENGWGRLNRSGPFSTWNVVGHREIYQFLGRSYATACPGAMDLDRIVRRGNEILDGDDFEMSAEDRALMQQAIDESRGVSQRLDRISWGKLDKLDKLDGLATSIQSWIGDAVKALTDIVTREGKGGRAYKNRETGYIVVLSERGRWMVDCGLDEQMVANLCDRGWCQRGIKEQSDSDWKWTLRQYDRLVIQPGPLPATLEAIAYPEGHRKAPAAVNPTPVAPVVLPEIEKK